MEEKKTAENGQKMITREEILKMIKEQLPLGLSKLKEQLGEKKFEKRIKKAAKLLVAGIEKKSAKKTPVKKVVTPVKKTVAPAKKTVVPAKKSIPAKKVAKKAVS